MRGYANAGALMTNGAYFSCLPSSEDIQNVLVGSQRITSMTACVDWSLAVMGGVMNEVMLLQLNARTQYLD
jgi:hypothetical protein